MVGWNTTAHHRNRPHPPHLRTLHPALAANARPAPHWALRTVHQPRLLGGWTHLICPLMSPTLSALGRPPSPTVVTLPPGFDLPDTTRPG